MMEDPVSQADLRPYPLWVRALIWVVPVVLVWGVLWWLVIKPVLQFTEVM